MNKFQRIAEANQVFTPGYPIHQQNLFSGRSDQLQRALETLSQSGRHPVIFGQRGVGKTSLANILGQVLQGLLSVKISCDGSDTFATIWNRVLHTASISFKQHALGFSAFVPLMSLMPFMRYLMNYCRCRLLFLLWVGFFRLTVRLFSEQ
jgi:hypothetical protein